jgi:ATP-dependent DNA helicase RecG
MVPSLSTPVAELPRVGPTTASRFRVLGIVSAQDLLLHYPFRHEDFRTLTPIGSAAIGSTVTVKGTLELVRSRRSPRRRLHLTEGLVRDATGALHVIWFNQPYLAKTLAGRTGEFLLAGRIESSYGVTLVNPVLEPAGPDPKHLGRIVPVYPATEGLSQRQIRTLLHGILPLANMLSEFIPKSVQSAHNLAGRSTAVRQIHFPDSPEHLTAATRRLKFEELFLVQLSALLARAGSAGRAPIIRFNQNVVKGFVANLPFALTDDQRRAAWEVLRDLEHDAPMARLLQGDVGSGKTVVAAIAAVNSTAAGFQTVLLSPTEVLAGQHGETLRKLTKAVPLRVGLLTASRRELDGKTVPKTTLVAAVRKGEVDLLIGTHALLATEIHFARLGFAVIDEQHRFGVEQRRALSRLASRGGESTPHLLSLSATPIPRSLALTLYGDLELSTIRYRPANRPPVSTQVLKAQEIEAALAAVRAAVSRGEQAFVICPLVEESDALGVSAATGEFQRLSEGPLSELKLGLLHGRLSGPRKSKALTDFSKGNTSVLVATPVVEVGIDVPNATVMVIEGAERFGLAQLHQLRGRVGRGPKPSTCFLIGDTASETAAARLAAVAATNDGFALSERDLELRGPGQRYGLAQSGLPDFRMATLGDTAIATEAGRAAKEVLAKDPTLSSFPELRTVLSEIPNSGSES